MMTRACCEVLEKLKGKTLVTAESLTGGGIGAALTAVPGSSEVYKGGVICYTNWVKEHVLGVPGDTDVTITVGRTDAAPYAVYDVAGVKLERNKVTEIVGDYYSNTGGLTITLNDAWQEDRNVIDLK